MKGAATNGGRVKQQKPTPRSSGRHRWWALFVAALLIVCVIVVVAPKIAKLLATVAPGVAVASDTPGAAVASDTPDPNLTNAPSDAPGTKPGAPAAGWLTSFAIAGAAVVLVTVASLALMRYRKQRNAAALEEAAVAPETDAEEAAWPMTPKMERKLGVVMNSAKAVMAGVDHDLEIAMASGDQAEMDRAQDAWAAKAMKVVDAHTLTPVFRGFLARRYVKRYKAIRVAATKKIQSVFRGHVVRQLAEFKSISDDTDMDTNEDSFYPSESRT
jgi:hypothetical protein